MDTLRHWFLRSASWASGANVACLAHFLGIRRVKSSMVKERKCGVAAGRGATGHVRHTDEMGEVGCGRHNDS